MNKHPKTDTPTDKDLKQATGIGRPNGTNNTDGAVEELEGENTFEGDVKNDTNRSGGVNPDHRGRTNK